jgi:hypothetical protein
VLGQELSRFAGAEFGVIRGSVETPEVWTAMALGFDILAVGFAGNAVLCEHRRPETNAPTSTPYLTTTLPVIFG